MLPGMPVANLEVSRFLTCGVSVAIGVAQGADRVLTSCVVVGEVVWVVRHLVVEIRIANTHRLGVCFRESSVIFSTRHSQLLSRVAFVRGHGREHGQFCPLVRSKVSGQCSRLDLSMKPVWMPASRLTAADRASWLGGAGST